MMTKKILFCFVALSSFHLLPASDSVCHPTVLNEDCEILFSLGAGNKAEVFLARDRYHNFFALKRMYSKEELSKRYPLNVVNGLFDDRGQSLIAQKEYTISRQLIHPSIIKIHRMFTQKDGDGYLHTYLVMDYINGKTIYETNAATQPPTLALRNCIDFLQGLSLGISNYYIHNDLYTSNFMYNVESRIKFIDLDSFGQWPDRDDRNSKESRTNGEYFQQIYEILHEILRRGNFGQGLGPLQEEMQELLLQKRDSLLWDQTIDRDSLKFFQGLIRSYKKFFEDKLI